MKSVKANERWEANVARYNELIASCGGIERKGKTMPYTSANGHMFSQINKDGELGIRFSSEDQKRHIEELGSGLFKSYGAVMRGYVLIPDTMWQDMDRLVRLMEESHAYVLSLDPK